MAVQTIWRGNLDGLSILGGGLVVGGYKVLLKPTTQASDAKVSYSRMQLLLVTRSQFLCSTRLPLLDSSSFSSAAALLPMLQIISSCNPSEVI